MIPMPRTTRSKHRSMRRHAPEPASAADTGDSTGRSPRPAQAVAGAQAVMFVPRLVYSRFCLGISTAAEMSNGPGQITPPNHISRGIIYIVSVTLLPDLQTKMVLERIEAHDVVPSIGVLDKCVHCSCSSLLKLLLVCHMCHMRSQGERY